MKMIFNLIVAVVVLSISSVFGEEKKGVLEKYGRGEKDDFLFFISEKSIYQITNNVDKNNFGKLVVVDGSFDDSKKTCSVDSIKLEKQDKEFTAVIDGVVLSHEKMKAPPLFVYTFPSGKKMFFNVRFKQVKNKMIFDKLCEFTVKLIVFKRPPDMSDPVIDDSNIPQMTEADASNRIAFEIMDVQEI